MPFQSSCALNKMPPNCLASCAPKDSSAASQDPKLLNNSLGLCANFREQQALLLGLEPPIGGIEGSRGTVSWLGFRSFRFLPESSELVVFCRV